MAKLSAVGSFSKDLAGLFGSGTALGLDEGRLIERFVASNDASAFEAILARHGPMVWGVCRRTLRDRNDAEDAFQATFLIFARRAGSIRDPGRLGGWLHGVACRVAARARRDASRRPTFEPGDLADAGADAGESLESRERADLLHGEIERLPERYRHPIVLCHLEGCTHEEAAERLGWPVGTVRGRLSRGRDRLREGLSRRGVASSALPAIIPQVPPALAGITVRAATSTVSGQVATGLASARAVAWMEGVSRTMTTLKLKATAWKTLVVTLAATGGVGAFALSRGQAEPPQPAPQLPAAPAQAPATSEIPRAKLATPAGWGGGGEGYELGVDETVKFSGKSSGCIRSTDDPGPFGSLTQGFMAARYRGKRLRLSAQVKVDGVEQQSGLWMRVNGKTPKPLAFDNMGDRPITGTADWKKYEVILDVPEEAEQIYFGFLLAGKGRAWVDDIAFEAVTKETVPTQPAPRGASLPFEPMNLGFETKEADEPVAAAPKTSRPRLRTPSGWGGGGEGYDLFRDEAEKHAGKSSGCIRSTDDPGVFGTFTQGFQAAKYRGKRLRLSAQVKVDGVERQSGLWMRVDGKERGGLAFDNMGDRPITGTADWKRYDVVLDIPNEAEEIYFGFLMAGKGRAWVDDITFEVVGKDVAATGMEVEPQHREGAFQSSLPAEPRNLDFER